MDWYWWVLLAVVVVGAAYRFNWFKGWTRKKKK